VCLAAVVVPAVGAVARRLDLGPVYLAVPTLLLMAVVALISRLLAGRPNGSTLPTATAAGAWRGLGLGAACLLLGFAWFGVPWGMTWLSLVPNGRRLLLALALFALILPWAFLLARGRQQLLGDGLVRRGGALLRGLTWLAMPLALWLGYHFLTVGRCALFVIPVTLLAVGFLVPLPLWLLRDRKGMTLARAISHAGATAWLPACHLPFVQGN
jgi:hypothetical protein